MMSDFVRWQEHWILRQPLLEEQAPELGHLEHELHFLLYSQETLLPEIWIINVK